MLVIAKPAVSCVIPFRHLKRALTKYTLRTLPLPLRALREIFL